MTSSSFALDVLTWAAIAQATLALGWAFAAAAGRLALAPRHARAIAQIALACVLAAPVAAVLAPRPAFVQPFADFYGGLRETGTAVARIVPNTPEEAARTSEHARTAGLRLPLTGLVGAAWALLALSLVGTAAWVARVRRLRRAVLEMPLVRRIGRFELRASDIHDVAFSALIPGVRARAAVVLPMALVFDARDRALTLRHEIEHHRLGDTFWAHLAELVCCLFFYAPTARALARMLERSQELACDESLLGRRGVSPQDYADCLVRAAETALRSRAPLPAGAAGMAASEQGTFLKRRIVMLLNSKKRKSGRLPVLALGFALLAAVAGAAITARSAVQDRTLTLKEAQELADRASVGSTIPLTVNEQVLAKLNHYVGTPQGRAWVREAFATLPQYRTMIERKLKEYDVPAELLAVPLAESGFVNSRVSPHQAAGLWQFMAQTARRYGLKVNAKLDERTHPEKETDAAMRYLVKLHKQFGDWRLALKGYNEGELHVQALIDEHKTRDPWKLETVAKSYGYLSSVTAAMILMKNPQIIE